jgi:hypothetical protein
MTDTLSPEAARAEHEKKQAFRRFNARVLEPGAMLFMLVGILFLCQPWVEFLHQYSVLVMLIGLIGFNVAVHIPAPDGPKIDEDDTGAVSISAAVKGNTHG